MRTLPRVRRRPVRVAWMAKVLTETPCSVFPRSARIHFYLFSQPHPCTQEGGGGGVQQESPLGMPSRMLHRRE